jgi:hypothetical protein
MNRGVVPKLWFLKCLLQIKQMFFSYLWKFTNKSSCWHKWVIWTCSILGSLWWVFFFWWGGGPIKEGPSPKEKKTYWLSPKLINNNHIIPYHIVNTSVACAVGPNVNLLYNVRWRQLVTLFWKEIMLELNGKPSSATMFSTDFSFQNLIIF